MISEARTGHEARRRKIFGRRKGPKLSAHQERLLETLLPKLALELEAGRDPRAYFTAPVADVWLEIGFGAGEHLLWQAEHHPRVGLIGAEPYVSGVAKLLSRLAAALPLSPLGGEGQGEGVHPPAAISTSTPHTSTPRGGRGEEMRGASDRFRLYSEDARNIVDALPPASLGRVFILFPDPWPKTRHHKRRFIQLETLDALARVMKAGAELRFASDDADYFNWTLERLIAHRAFAWTAQCARDWQTRSNDWPQTRYEAKALHGAPAFLRAIRI